MDTNGSEGTWMSDGYADTRNDLVEQSSAVEYAQFEERYEDSPPSVKSRDAIFLTGCGVTRSLGRINLEKTNEYFSPINTHTQNMSQEKVRNVDNRLNEAEKQLEATESKYVSAMARLRYLKLLYDTAGSMSLETTDYNRTDESAITEGNSQSDASDENCENNLTFGDAQHPAQESNNVERPEQAGSESAEQGPMYTSTSIKITSGPNTFHDATNENSHDRDGQNRYSESAKGGSTNFLYKDSTGYSETDHTNRIRKEHLTGSTRMQHPYQLHLAEYSKGLQDELEEELRKNAGSPKLEDQETHSDALKSSRRQDSKEPALHLNLSESVETVQTLIKNKKLRNKQRRVSSKIALKSIDDTAGPILKRKRKKRAGVKISNSRCTTATRDTGISENKKDVRSRKQRGHSTISRLQQSQKYRQDVPTKSENSKSEVVEIYHNTAVKSGSLSVVSSKHSKVMDSRVRGFNAANKLDQPWRTKGSYRLVENNDPGKRVCDDIEEQKSRRQENNELTEPTENCENDYEASQENLVETTDFRSGEPNSTSYRADYSADQSENKITKGDRHHRHNRQSPRNCSSPCYDLVSSRNYELPTVSSRLKQVHKSYFHRFNFKNIPFVVGTSITPSYNLGLNIQEALNLMKTRQGLSSGVPPLMISHVTKGMKPVSRLFGCMDDENDIGQLDERNTPWNASSRGVSNFHPGVLIEEKMSRSVPQGGFRLKTPRLNMIPDTETLYEARPCTNPKIELTANAQKSRSICLSIKNNLHKNVEAKPQLTQSTLLRQRQDEIDSGDTQPNQQIKWQNVTQNTKGIREVLMNFHDQYEAMISKFEKLQDQAKKTNDKSLDKEIAALEKELNAKEEEINAVASLYQEVMILKEQMKMLHERNSLVCVTTESPRGPTSPHFTFRAQATNPIRMINFYRRGGLANNQGPPTSTKLAGLLRQIKTFQKQLKSTA